MTSPQIDGTPYLERVRRAEARWPEPPRGNYPHSSECRRRGTEVRWELTDFESGVWRRSCSEAGCGMVQYHAPKTPPPPPRPTAEQLAGWQHTFACTAPDGRTSVTLPCPNQEPVIDVQLVADEGERGRQGLMHWMARCQLCGAIRRFVAEASDHYRTHAVEVPGPSGFRLDQLGSGDHEGPVYVTPARRDGDGRWPV